jgi:hypothetical protein
MSISIYRISDIPVFLPAPKIVTAEIYLLSVLLIQAHATITQECFVIAHLNKLAMHKIKQEKKKGWTVTCLQSDPNDLFAG